MFFFIDMSYFFVDVILKSIINFTSMFIIYLYNLVDTIKQINDFRENIFFIINIYSPPIYVHTII